MEHPDNQTPRKELNKPTEIKKEYPNVIYEQISDLPQTKLLVNASCTAMAESGFPVVMDIEQDGENGVYRVSVRTKDTERREMKGQAALFLGLSEATRKAVENESDSTDYFDKALSTSKGILGEFKEKEGLFKEFQDYYSGLGWGTDKEKFVRSIFEYGIEYSADTVKTNISGNLLSNIVYDLDLDISYEKRSKWNQTKVESILGSYPKLDYRKLEKEAFRNSDEGKKLMDVYQREIGGVLYDQYRRGELQVSEDGKKIDKPLIPLSKFPIIEALVCDEVSLDKPKAKYDFGRGDFVDEIVGSDSAAAHEALIRNLCTRLPEDQRHVFDGPSEFRHKRGNVLSILRKYNDLQDNETKSTLLRNDILKLLEEYTGQGQIAEDVRQEASEYLSRNGNEYMPSSVNEVQDIVKDLLQVSLASSDASIVGRAKDIIDSYLPNSGKEIVGGVDILSLTRTELMLVLLDSTREVVGNSNPNVFSEIGTKVFGSQQMGNRLVDFADMQKRIANLRDQPQVLLAWKGIKRFGISINDEKSPEEIAARSLYEDLSRPSNELSERLHKERNEFMLGLMKDIVRGEMDGMDENSRNELFVGLLDRVTFSDYKMQTLPSEYFSLIDIADMPSASLEMKEKIVWHITEQFKYVGNENTSLMLPVLRDIYRLMLGPEGNVAMPNRTINLGLAAATSLVREHGKNMFKAASPEDLKLLESYASGIRQIANRIAGGELLPDQVQNSDIDKQDFVSWQKEMRHTLEGTVRELSAISEYYREYLHMEAVKVKPDIYYPWLIQQLVPFWQKMQWEVGPGNEPRPDIRRLYSTIKDYVQNRFAIKEEYPENFDVFREGNLDGFLHEMYNQMIVPHDIKYNSTVWNEGLGFMHMAVAYMPEIVVQQIEEKYPDSSFAKYVRNEHGYWNKE